ncbi:MAG: tetratricopeptide repeat protein [Candidatus Wallbacteria bacterium]|nr:tetratricopeptide repeat protein [Candidatus Wallbacteria bacterium]
MSPVFPVFFLLLAAAVQAGGAGTTAEQVHGRARELLEGKGTAAEALVVLEEGLRAHPKAEALHRLAGIAAFRERKVERARTAFEAAIRLKPEEPFNYLKLASLHVCERADVKSADQVLARLFAVQPRDVASREEAAAMWAECGETDRAISLWLALARLAPSQAWMYRFKAGQLYHAGGRYQDARSLLGRALADGPKSSAELPAQLGATLARMGEKKEAARLFRVALARRPDLALRQRLETELGALQAR